MSTFIAIYLETVYYAEHILITMQKSYMDIIRGIFMAIVQGYIVIVQEHIFVIIQGICVYHTKNIYGPHIGI